MRTIGLSERGRLLSRLGLLAAGYLVCFAVVYYVTVRTVDGRLLSDASLRGAMSTSEIVGGLDSVLNVVSIASLLGAVAVVALVALIRLARIQGLAAIGVLVTANLSSLLLKDYLLPRPDLGLDEIAPATLNSLPSGHSTAAFSVAAALLLVVPRRWRLAVATVGAAYVAVTGMATMLAGWHRAADSIAASLLVGFWATVAAGAALVWLPTGNGVVASAAQRSLRWLAATTVGCLAMGTAIAIALDRSASVRDSIVGSWVAFLLAALLITGTVVGVMIGILRSLDAVDALVSTGRPRSGPEEPPSPSTTARRGRG